MRTGADRLEHPVAKEEDDPPKDVRRVLQSILSVLLDSFTMRRRFFCFRYRFVLLVAMQDWNDRQKESKEQAAVLAGPPALSHQADLVRRIMTPINGRCFRRTQAAATKLLACCEPRTRPKAPSCKMNGRHAKSSLSRAIRSSSAIEYIEPSSYTTRSKKRPFVPFSERLDVRFEFLQLPCSAIQVRFRFE